MGSRANWPEPALAAGVSHEWVNGEALHPISSKSSTHEDTKAGILANGNPDLSQFKVPHVRQGAAVTFAAE